MASSHVFGVFQAASFIVRIGNGASGRVGYGTEAPCPVVAERERATADVGGGSQLASSVIGKRRFVSIDIDDSRQCASSVEGISAPPLDRVGVGAVSVFNQFREDPRGCDEAAGARIELGLAAVSVGDGRGAEAIEGQLHPIGKGPSWAEYGRFPRLCGQRAVGPGHFQPGPPAVDRQVRCRLVVVPGSRVYGVSLTRLRAGKFAWIASAPSGIG